MAVFLLGKHREALMPCSEKRSRSPLKCGRGCVQLMYQFTTRLLGRAQPLALKIDPGSKQTGIGLVRKNENTTTVLSPVELKHRDAVIRKASKQRSDFRRRRRSREVRSWTFLDSESSCARRGLRRQHGLVAEVCWWSRGCFKHG